MRYGKSIILLLLLLLLLLQPPARSGRHIRVARMRASADATSAGEGITVEAHIFDFEGDLYGSTLRIAFVEFLRPEMKFDGIQAIRAQIERDCAAARTVLDDDTARAPSSPQLSGAPAT